MAGLAVVYDESGPSLLARALGSYLGRHVEITGLEIRVGRTFTVELKGVRVFAGPEPEGEPMVAIPHAVGRQSWPRLLAGQLLPSSWTVDQPIVRIEVGAEPGMRAQLAVPALPTLELDVKGARIMLERASGPPIRITELNLSTTRSGLPSRASGTASGRLWVGVAPLASFDLALESWARELTLDGQVQDLQLESLPLPEAFRLRGDGSGRIRVRSRGELLEVEVDLQLASLEAEVEQLDGTIAPSHTRVAATVSWDGTALSLRANPLRMDDFVLNGEMRIGTGPGARVHASIDLADFEPGVPSLGRVQPLSLMGRRFASWIQLDQRIEAGRIEGVHIEADLALDGLASALAFERKLTPEELHVVAEVRGIVYRTSPDSPPLEEVTGRAEIQGNRLVLRDVRMERSGTPLPTIDVTIDGMHRVVRLPPEERGVPPGPGVGIPGLGAGTRALRGDGEGYPPPVIQLSDFQLGYSAFLLPIRDARGTLRFPPGKVVVEAVEAVIGGAPGQLWAVYDSDRNSVEVHVEYGDGDAPQRRDPGEYWASGEFSIATLNLGPWRLDQLSGTLEATRARVEVPRFDAWFSYGSTHGFGRFDLGDPHAAEYEFFASVAEADAAGLTRPLERPAGSITGRLSLDGRFAGRLGPELNFIEECDFGMTARIENGTFGETPALLVLARLPSLQGFRGLFGAQLPFDVVSADISLRDGVLRTEHLALQGPELRAHARGTIDMASDDLQSDFELAFLLLQTVDRVLGNLPILGRWMLGEDESLVAIYLQFDGPWADPRVRPMAPSAVQTAASWAVRVVTNGANQLLRVFGARRPPPQEDEEEPLGDGASAGQDP